MIRYNNKTRTLEYVIHGKLKKVQLSQDESERYLNQFSRVTNITALEELIKQHFKLSDFTFDILTTSTKVKSKKEVNETKNEINELIKLLLKLTPVQDKDEIENVFELLKSDVVDRYSNRIGLFKEFFLSEVDTSKGIKTVENNMTLTKYKFKYCDQIGEIYTRSQDKNKILFIKYDNVNRPFIVDMILSDLFNPEKYKINGISTRSECVAMYFNEVVMKVTKEPETKYILTGCLFRPLIKTNSSTPGIKFDKNEIQCYNSLEDLKNQIQIHNTVDDYSIELSSNQANSVNQVDIDFGQLVTYSRQQLEDRTGATGNKSMGMTDKHSDVRSTLKFKLRFREGSEFVLLKNEKSIKNYLERTIKNINPDQSNPDVKRLNLNSFTRIRHSNNNDSNSDGIKNVFDYVDSLIKYFIDESKYQLGQINSLKSIISVCYKYNLFLPSDVIERGFLTSEQFERMLRLDEGQSTINLNCILLLLSSKSILDDDDDNELLKSLYQIVNNSNQEDIESIIESNDLKHLISQSQTNIVKEVSQLLMNSESNNVENQIENENENQNDVIDIEPLGEDNESNNEIVIPPEVIKWIDKNSEQIVSLDRINKISRNEENHENFKNIISNLIINDLKIKLMKREMKEHDVDYNDEINQLENQNQKIKNELESKYKLSKSDVKKLTNNQYLHEKMNLNEFWKSDVKSGVTEFSTLNEISSKLDVIINLMSNGSIDTSNISTDDHTLKMSSPNSSTKIESNEIKELKPIERKYKSLIEDLDQKYSERYGSKSGFSKRFDDLETYINVDFQNKVNGGLYDLHIQNKGIQEIIDEFNPDDLEVIYVIGESIKVDNDGSIKPVDESKGGIFTKLLTLIPGAAPIYKAASTIYNLAKPVINKVINKYNDKYTEVTGNKLDESYYQRGSCFTKGLLDINKLQQAMKSNSRIDLGEFRDLING